MKELGRALGGSNEPFLNKPARTTELSKSNSVRKGKDKELLFSQCDNLSLIDSNQAYVSLVYIIKIELHFDEKVQKYFANDKEGGSPDDGDSSSFYFAY